MNISAANCHRHGVLHYKTTVPWEKPAARTWGGVQLGNFQLPSYIASHDHIPHVSATAEPAETCRYIVCYRNSTPRQPTAIDVGDAPLAMVRIDFS